MDKKALSFFPVVAKNFHISTVKNSSAALSVSSLFHSAIIKPVISEVLFSIYLTP